VLIPFFLIHFSMFMLVHLMFIIIIFGQELWGSSFFIPFAAVFNIGSYFKIILPGFFLLFISHGYSFYVNFIKKYEYEKIDGKALMFQPYQRIGVMHFTIIFGAFLYMLSGELLTVLILLIVLKIGVDLRAHVKERKRMAFQQGFAKLFDF